VWFVWELQTKNAWFDVVATGNASCWCVWSCSVSFWQYLCDYDAKWLAIASILCLWFGLANV